MIKATKSLLNEISEFCEKYNLINNTQDENYRFLLTNQMGELTSKREKELFTTWVFLSGFDFAMRNLDKDSTESKTILTE